MRRQLIWIIAGTSEARALIERLATYDVDICASVATNYGESLLAEQANLQIIRKRMQYQEMLDFLHTHRPDLVIDATHPYAQIVTQNISRACQDSATRFLRLHRSECLCTDDIVHVDTTAAAVDFLANTDGQIFLTTGSKELQEFCRLPDFQARIHARILPMLDGLSKAMELGFSPAKIICMQGPFSTELNRAMLQACAARYLVTKNSGSNGGFAEKLEAAAELGVQVVVIGRPPDVQGLSADAVWRELEKLGLKTIG